jgi:hypothetical protein
MQSKAATAASEVAAAAAMLSGKNRAKTNAATTAVLAMPLPAHAFHRLVRISAPPTA